MTTREPNDSHDGGLPNGDLPDRDLVRLLRGASAHGLDDGAADRIADAAWARATASAGSGRVVRFPPLMRRAAIAAAAVVAIAAGSFWLRGTEPALALAVEGNPVNVWHDGWVEVDRVFGQSTVFATPGSVLRAPDGSEIHPTEGAMFRVVEGDSGSSFRIELMRGKTEVTGRAFTVFSRDLEAVTSGADTRFTATISVSGDFSEPPPLPIATTTGELELCVLRGRALVSLLSTGEKVEVDGNQRVWATRVGTGSERSMRLMRLESWKPDRAIEIAAGRLPMGAVQMGDHVRVMLGTGIDDALTALEIPEDQLHVVLPQIDAAQNEFVTFVTELMSQDTRAITSVAALEWTQAEEPVAELTRRGEQGSTSIALFASGRVAVTRGAETDVYVDLAAARVVESELVEHLAAFMAPEDDGADREE